MKLNVGNGAGEDDVFVTKIFEIEMRVVASLVGTEVVDTAGVVTKILETVMRVESSLRSGTLVAAARTGIFRMPEPMRSMKVRKFVRRIIDANLGF